MLTRLAPQACRELPFHIFFPPFFHLRPSLLLMAAAKLMIICSLISACISLLSSLAAAELPLICVFSDVDGTLVHYPKNHHATDTIYASSSAVATTTNCLPPSKTDTRGVLSKRTLELCHEMGTGSLVFVDDKMQC
jgi:hypothetical protein